MKSSLMILEMMMKTLMISKLTELSMLHSKFSEDIWDLDFPLLSKTSFSMSMTC